MQVADNLDLAAMTDLLAAEGPIKARDLAERLEAEYIEVRDALVKLEKLGVVYRTGRTRGTRWWLG